MREALRSRESVSGAEQSGAQVGVEQALTDTVRVEVDARHSRGNGITEQPATEVGGFTRVAADWKSTRFPTRAKVKARSTTVAEHHGPQEL